MINFILMFSRVGKVRLQKWYQTYTQKEKRRWMREITTTVLNRKAKMCNFLEFHGHKIVYRRYASLHIAMAIEEEDNELISLEVIHRLVELLDKYFGNVCELDIIFNFHKTYFVLDEFIIGGELCESSKKHVIRAVDMCDQNHIETEGANSKNRDLIEKQDGVKSR